ncbi:MAG: C45 family autoproteolytic acyltransferase/hydrolase [Eubacteriales bacterium]|nr:C45 family autoproteolytic acyltransferase/hydrolase [Eubacteriales bacterium]
MKNAILMILALGLVLGPAAALAQTANPAAFITNEAQLKTLGTIVNIDVGRLYVMDYTAGYLLDEALAMGLATVEDLMEFAQDKLVGGGDIQAHAQPFACSAFTATTAEGEVLFGRNFDYKMDMTALLLRTSPPGGYRSLSLVDMGWLGYGLGSLDDGTTDLSAAIAAPYALMDGMNEKGLAVTVLLLHDKPTGQDTGKNKIGTTIAMRMVLDKAKDVGEAIALIEQYDMQSSMENVSFHFMLADATGRVAVVEYCDNIMEVLEENKVTNFYLSPTMAGLGHGKDRYAILDAALAFKANTLTRFEAMALLSLVSQQETEESTSMTQWSAMYDLSRKQVAVAIRGDFSRQFNFSLDDISGETRQLP